MGDKQIRIKLKIDADSAEIIVAEKDLKNLGNAISGTGKKAGDASKGVGLLGGSLTKLVGMTAGLFTLKAVFDGIVSTGYRYNGMMENQLASMQRMIVATSGNITAEGDLLTVREKYNLAQVEAIETTAELQRINALTPHTLGQTIQIYNALYPSMKKTGASTLEMIELTQKLSVTAGSMDFGQLLAGVDGLATGTVLASSEFGRFLGSLGLTNEALKSTNDPARLVLDTLKEMNVSLDTMSEATSNLTNAWDQFAGVVTKDIFDVSKQGIKEASSWLGTLTEQWHSLLLQYKEAKDIKTLDDINIRLLQLNRDLEEEQREAAAQNSRNSRRSHQEETGARLENIAALKEEIALLHQKRDEINNRGTLVEKNASLADLELNQEAKEAIAKYNESLDAESLKLTQQNELLYDSMIKLIGSDYDKFLQQVSKELVTLGSAGATPAQQLAYFKEQEKAFYDDQVERDLDSFTSGEKELGGFKPEWDFVLPQDQIGDTAKNWANTLSNSTNSALVDVLTGGDVLAAVQGIGNATAASVIQASVSNLSSEAAAGLGDLTDNIGSLVASVLDDVTPLVTSLISDSTQQQIQSAASEGASEAAGGAIGGVLAGLAVSAFANALTAEGGNLMEDDLSKILDELKRQTELLNAQIGLYRSIGIMGTETKAAAEKAQNDYVASLVSAYNDNGVIFVDKSLEKKLTDGLGSALSELESVEGAFIDAYGRAVYDRVRDGIIAASNNFASSLIDLSNSISSIADDLNEILTDITGSDILYDAKLSAARDNVGSLVDGDLTKESYTDFLTNLVISIDSFGTSISELEAQLTSEDPARQEDAVQTLSDMTGTYFDSIEEALNLLESIELVGEAYAETADALVTGLTSMRSVAIYNAGSNTVEAHRLRAQYAREDLDSYASTIGADGATLANYDKLYSEMLKTNPTADMIESWAKLGDMLVDADAAAQEYASSMGDSLKNIDDFYLGRYGGLSLLQQSEYANNVAYSAAASGDIESELEAKYNALVAKAAVVATDEELAPLQRAYAQLLSEQARDSTRKDIVTEIQATNKKLDDLTRKFKTLSERIA